MNCETCTYYFWDDEMGCYICQMPLDEDELEKLISGSNRICPYYRQEDEYKIVRKQN